MAAADTGVLLLLGWAGGRSGRLPSFQTQYMGILPALYLPGQLAASPPFFCKSDRLPGNCWGVQEEGNVGVTWSHSDPGLSSGVEQAPPVIPKMSLTATVEIK